MLERQLARLPIMFESLKATKRLKDIEERLETVERSFKRMQMEWEDAFDKLRTLMQRIAKRAQVVERHEREEAEEPTDQPEQPSLPQLDPVSARILARRQRITGRPS